MRSNKKYLSYLIFGLVMCSNVVFSSEIKQGGTLTVPIINTGFVKNFNPYTSKDLLQGIMFEPLLWFNTMAGKTEYRLAKSLIISDDLTEITVKLRDGLKWSDGIPLTASDVVYSYEMTKSAPAFDTKAIWTSGNLISITAKNNTTISFKLKHPDSTFIWSLPAYTIVPKHIWSKVSAKDMATFTNPNPVGSGPFTTVKYLKPQEFKLCRNKNYYLANRPYIDCIKYRSYNDNSQLQPALMKGEIDWGSNFIADIDNTYVKANPQYHHYWYPADDAIHLYMNTKIKPFDDIRVRQALSMAVDRAAIVDLAAYGYPTANYDVGGIGELYSQFINKDIQKKYKNLTKYNPKKAKALLDAAGYKDLNGDGYRDFPNGKMISFDIDVVSGWTDWIQVVQMVTEYYKAVGIKASIKTVDWAVYDKSLKEGDYKMAINWSMVAANPIIAYQAYYLTSQIGKTWHGGHGVHSPKIDKLINSFGLTKDPVKQQAILDQLQAFTAEKMPFIPLFSNPTWYQYSTEKFTGWPSAKNPYVQPVFYDGSKRNLIIDHLHLK